MAKKQSNINTNIAGSLSALTGTSSTTTTITTSGSNLVYSANNGTLVWSGTKATYHVLGEDVEVSSSYVDGNTAMMIATLNVLGKPFLDELHKNNVFFPTEIEEYLEKKFKWIERDKKIDDIIN
jgi:hypothetical protein